MIRSKGYPHSTYITLNSPLLKNVDENGLLFGSLKNLSTILEQNVPLNENRSFVKWGFFAPSSTGIEAIQNLVEANQVNFLHYQCLNSLINTLSKSRS